MASLRLVGSDNTDIRVLTDSLGYYRIDSNHFSVKVKYILSARKDEYYNSDEREMVEPANNSKIDTITKNFVLKSLSDYTGCRFYSPVYFQKNSFSLSKGVEDTVLYIVYRLLNNNPTLIFAINGHADQKELHPMTISYKRAQACKDYLVSIGIDSARLVVKGWGDTKPIFKMEQINAVKTQSEKDSLLQMNRRAVFQVNGWGYSKK